MRVAVGVAGALLLAGCGDDDPVATSAPVVVPEELTVQWDMLSHRISLLELGFDPSATGGTVRSVNHGGPFGLIDGARARYGLSVWRSERLVAVPGSITIAIEPGAEVDGETFSSVDRAEVPAGALAQATALLGVVRGYRFDTDAYSSPPPFQTDPLLPYDPADGFTTQGIGIALAEPQLEGGVVALEVRVRQSLGQCDRPDMNAAIAQATTWVTVDFTILGVLGEGAAVSRGVTEYTMSTAEYGQATEHVHAPVSDQAVQIDGTPGLGRGLLGVTAFDLWVNVDGHRDPSCVVDQDEINSWGDAVSGPGRYVRELSVRLGAPSYDPASGRGIAALDMFFSNASEFYEVGNQCVGARGEVGLLQFDDTAATETRLGTVEVAVDPAEGGSAEVTF